jgi:peptidoglycan/LPS O-acetylase OafA/YrhL
MFRPAMPSISLLAKTNLQQDHHHSIFISVLRGLAAIQVAAAHLRAQFYPGLRGMEDPSLAYQMLAFFTGFAHQAVVVFFLLSGWLVGGSLLNKLGERGAFISYTIDRFTRLWLVLIPAFLLTLLIGILTHEVNPTQFDFAHDNEYSVVSFAGNLFGLQDMAVGRYGGNFALWSLANEFWYYVLFPLCVLGFASRTMPLRLAALAAAIVLCCLLASSLVLYFTIWLLGVLFSRLRIDMNGAARGMLVLVLLAVSVYFRLIGSNDLLTEQSFWQDLAFSVLFMTLLASLQFRADASRLFTRALKRTGDVFAPFSFTLYVIHVPLIFYLQYALVPLIGTKLSPHDWMHLGMYMLMLAGILASAWLFYLPFEAQTGRVRGWIKSLVWGRVRQAGVAG